MKVPLPLLLVVGIVGCGYGSSPPNGEAVDDAQSKAENGVAEFALPKTTNGVAKAHQPNADKPLAPAADANPVVAPKDRRGQQRIAVIDLERVIREDTDPFLPGIVRRTEVRARYLNLNPIRKNGVEHIRGQLEDIRGQLRVAQEPMLKRTLTGALQMLKRRLTDALEMVVQSKKRVHQMETELDGLFKKAEYSPGHIPRLFPREDRYSLALYSQWRLMRMQDAVAVVAKQHGYNVVLNFRPMQRRPRRWTRGGPRSSGLTIRSSGGSREWRVVSGAVRWDFDAGPSTLSTAHFGFEGDGYSGLVVFHDKQDDITDLVIELLKRE